MYLGNDFAFIHINKTGGRSAVKFMKDNVIGFHCVGTEFVHKAYWDVKQFADNKKRLLSIIRNPFDRYESLYSYRRQKFENNIGLEHDNQCFDAATLKFTDWMDRILQSGKILDSPQSEFLDPFPDNLTLVRLENIQEELCAFLGIDQETHKIPHINKSVRAKVRWPKALRRDVYDVEEAIFEYYTKEVKKYDEQNCSSLSARIRNIYRSNRGCLDLDCRRF